jgi:hypothetical protein
VTAVAWTGRLVEKRKMHSRWGKGQRGLMGPTVLLLLFFPLYKIFFLACYIKSNLKVF